MNRLAEASLVGRKLGDYLASKNVDLSAIPKLIEKVESTLIPIPGTGVLMQKTDFTVGDWNLYIKARGMPEWEQPNPFEFVQGDDHPVVNVSWNDAVEFCKWLSGVSSSKYRLPYFKERKAASGGSKYPWGVHWPPRKDDGNYAINADGKGDSAGAGVDGVKGTCAVGKFKPNALGFFDLGGNVCEWDIDTHADNNRISGGSWTTGDENHMRMESGFYGGNNKATKRADLGFRVIKEM
jgi:formylglycine-generating enzyme required for sulfatase activity